MFKPQRNRKVQWKWIEKIFLECSVYLTRLVLKLNKSFRSMHRCPFLMIKYPFLSETQKVYQLTGVTMVSVGGGAVDIDVIPDCDVTDAAAAPGCALIVTPLSALLACMLLRRISWASRSALRYSGGRGAWLPMRPRSISSSLSVGDGKDKWMLRFIFISVLQKNRTLYMVAKATWSVHDKWFGLFPGLG